jgi:hypothetical protein
MGSFKKSRGRIILPGKDLANFKGNPSLTRGDAMPRVEADVCITLKRRGMKAQGIELIRLPVGRRFRVRTDGKLSSKLPEATATEVADRIRHWIRQSM